MKVQPAAWGKYRYLAPKSRTLRLISRTGSLPISESTCRSNSMWTRTLVDVDASGDSRPVTAPTCCAGSPRPRWAGSEEITWRVVSVRPNPAVPAAWL